MTVEEILEMLRQHKEDYENPGSYMEDRICSTNGLV